MPMTEIKCQNLLPFYLLKASIPLLLGRLIALLTAPATSLLIPPLISLLVPPLISRLDPPLISLLLRPWILPLILSWTLHLIPPLMFPLPRVLPHLVLLPAQVEQDLHCHTPQQSDPDPVP